MSMRVLERDTHVTPLGVRFRDVVTGDVVTDGLVVTHPVSRPPGRAAAVLTPSGAFAASGLPGLRRSELGVGDPAYWNDPPAAATYRIDVRDTRGWFHAFTFDAELPARGLFTPACVETHSPPLGGDVPLFSTPARPVPPGLGVLRAELWDETAGRPAAWAVLEATVAGMRTAVGVADARGNVAVILPYPEPVNLEASPPRDRKSLADQAWQVGVRALYEPAAEPPAVPDLCAILDQQPGRLLARRTPPATLTTVTLEFARELVVTTTGRPRLLVVPAGSNL